jgi:hypothetical protein
MIAIDARRASMIGCVLAVGLLIAAPVASANPPTAKQVFVAKVRGAANAYAARHGWHISDPIVASVSTTTFLGTTNGYGSAVVSMEGGGTIAAASWNAKLARSHGRWIVTNLSLGPVSRVG